MSDKRTIGIVKWFDDKKGIGFISTDDMPGIDVFVYYTEIKMDGYKFLNDGQRVSFMLDKGEKGYRATDVVRLDLTCDFEVLSDGA